MGEVIAFFKSLFMAESWPARWFCGTWTQFHGWLYVCADIAIWGAYFAIPFIIVLFIAKRKEELPFIKIFWLFILFILMCGSTHLIDAIMFWYPAYRLSAFLLFITALVSWTTVYFLVKILPEALSLKSPAQLEEIILERTAELQESNEHQIKLNQDLDHFVYSASHDLKSPINNIEGLFMLLKLDMERQNTISENKDLIDKIDISLVRVKHTISSLSDILKVQRNPYEDTERIRFMDLFSEIMFENQEMIRQAEVSVSQNFEVDSIEYSRAGLKSIIYNLIINSVKYRSLNRKALVNVRTFVENDRVVLTVEDNGLGIDLPKNLEKVFGLFKRLHDHVEGSGIGLYIN